MKTKLIGLDEVIIYKNRDSYVHNPVVELLQDGDLVCVFREAPRRRIRTHIDMASQAVMVRSKDRGRTWEPATRQVIYQEPGHGIQDPSVRQLRDGTLLCNLFVWTSGGQTDFPVNHAWLQVSDAEHYSWTTGSYTIWSADNGKTWEKPVMVPSPSGDCTATADPVIELKNGELLIPIEMEVPGERTRTGVARSRDKGRSWDGVVVTAADPLGHYSFHESGLLQLPSGKIIAIHRVHQLGEYEYGWYLYQTDSNDDGRTWSPPRKLPMWGGPANLIRLQSGRILCVYGYRRPPYGSRACWSHDEGETWDIANEFILHSTGIDADVGYPTSVQLEEGSIFTAWYASEPDQEKKAGGVKFSIFAYHRPLTYIGGRFYRET
jgi:sialidase-1